ncbi:MAG: GGDEF domain-containing protein [Campylobacterales bacterium]|nr:GGDEF domain-containing protein [Campylobacterales bacterium]
MILPKIKEREYRFKLALRIGLPIFALFIAFISHTFLTTYENLQVTFYIESAILLIVYVYFTFYLIYKGFDKNITDRVTNTFSREYLFEYLQKDMEKEKEYTLLLIRVDNLYDINNTYGVKNGDKVLLEVTRWVVDYLSENNIKNFPIGRIDGGGFIVGLKGIDIKYSTLAELISIKTQDFKVGDIEVKISSAITDTKYSKDFDFLIEKLFYLQDEKKVKNNDELDPNELELAVINAIKEKSFILSTQDVFEDDKVVIKECFVKLKSKDSKLIYPKTFTKVINKLGLSSDYDLMIFEKNIKKCKFITNEIIAFSISSNSLRNPAFLLRVKELLNKDLRNKIMFILSEIEYFSNIDRYNTILNSLRELGIYIVLDRLGSLHTSFLYLRDLDVDVVRFDPFYTKDIIKYQNIIEGFNTMAHLKGVKTWMKMVESEDSKKLVKAMGVDYLQGKYLSELELKYEN